MASPDKDNAKLSAFVKEDVEEYAYFRAIVRDKQDQVITLKCIKEGQCIFVDKAELTLATTAAASHCVTGTDLEDEERENRNCEVEDDHPDPAILVFERPERQNRSLRYHQILEDLLYS